MTPRLAYAAVLAIACSSPPAELTNPPSDSTPVECQAFEPLPNDRLSLESARRAHRWAELVRHLRYYDAIDPRFILDETAALIRQENIERGQICFEDLYRVGRILFQHEYSLEDGLGNGLSAESRDRPFRRVQTGKSGPETIGCTSCHWSGGPAGSGAMTDDTFMLGDGDTVGSADVRNPPPLPGVGVVQALAAEMTADLHAIRDQLLERARTEKRPVSAELVTKGVSFGTLRAGPMGDLSMREVSGIDADLVVKPFGWKGNFTTLRDFLTESLHGHLGIQSEDLIARAAERPEDFELGDGADPKDPDADGVAAELTAGQLTALIAYLAAQEMPVMRPHETVTDFDDTDAQSEPIWLEEWAQGRRLFDEIGCNTCHTPMLVLNDPTFETVSYATGGAYHFDLSTQAERPRIQRDPIAGGYPVWLFSDLKRHDLGEENAALHEQRGVGRRMYQTRRLWGLANSAPYFYDGKSPTLDDAIARHGGEAAFARAGFDSLNYGEKGALRAFLVSLRREWRAVVP